MRKSMKPALPRRVKEIGLVAKAFLTDVQVTETLRVTKRPSRKSAATLAGMNLNNANPGSRDCRQS